MLIDINQARAEHESIHRYQYYYERKLFTFNKRTGFFKSRKIFGNISFHSRYCFR